MKFFNYERGLITVRYCASNFWPIGFPGSVCIYTVVVISWRANISKVACPVALQYVFSCEEGISRSKFGAITPLGVLQTFSVFIFHSICRVAFGESEHITGESLSLLHAQVSPLKKVPFLFSLRCPQGDTQQKHFPIQAWVRGGVLAGVPSLIFPLSILWLDKL